MRLGPFIWTGFRDLATPEEMADIMVELYGARAAGKAAESSAAAAWADDREDDADFWDSTQLVLYRRFPALRTATAPPR